MKVLIVGIGKLGYQLADAFSQKGNDVIAMDRDRDALQRAEEHMDVLTILHNGFEIEALKEAHIKDLDLTVAVTDDDETNILIAFVAKRLGTKKVIARVRNPEYDRQAEFLRSEMDIDRIINPELATAREIYRYLTGGLPFHTEVFEASGVMMADIHASALTGVIKKPIRDLGIPKSLLIAAIVRDGKVVIPHGQTVIEKDDMLYLLGSADTIRSFHSSRAEGGPQKPVENVTILGGGRLAYYLSISLLTRGMSVRIIEIDKARCQYLAERLGNALIIHGDATDINLLREEGVFNSDAVVSVTGFDEENLLIGLMCKQSGAGRVIAKVSRPGYVPVIEKFGIDMAVNPVLITAADIIRYVQGGNIRSLTMIAGGKAELTELVIQQGAYVLDDTLEKLNLPQGIIVGTIFRDGKIIIPDGGTKLEEGDKVLVFAAQADRLKVDRYFSPRRKGLFK